MSVLQVCIELFGFSVIFTTDNSRRISWITDASIPYFQNGHIPMLLIAVILTLVYLLPFPFFLLFPSLVFKSKYLRKLKPFYDAYWHPFEPKFRFWLGFRLIFRWIPFCLSLFVRSPLNLFITNFLLLVLLFVQVIAKPFKNWWVNTIDSLFIFLLTLMFSGTLFFAAEVEINNNEGLVIGELTIYNEFINILAFLLMCGLFYYHLYIRFPRVKRFSQTFWYKLRCKKGKITYNSQIEIDKSQGEEKSTGLTKLNKPKVVPTRAIVTTELREPLLDDDNFATVVTVPSNNANPHAHTA